jgi:Toprim domain/CHC2 zinc finger
VISEADIRRARAVPIESVLGAHKLKRIGKELLGPCPVHGGDDRFAVHLTKQLFNCRGADGGDVIDMVRHLHGCDFVDAVRTLIGDVSTYIPPPSPRPAAPRAPPADNRFWELLWDQGQRHATTAIEEYLGLRGVVDLLPAGALGDVLRYHPHCPFGPDRQSPAMLALVRDIRTDLPQAIVRTALERNADGSIKTRGVRRMTLGPWKGGAIKLSANDAVENCLGVGEGPESTLSLRSRPQFCMLPVWSLISDRGIADFPVLPGIETLFVAVDNDKVDEKTGRCAGHDAAEECGDRWTDAGRDCFHVSSPILGEDLNDVARRTGSMMLRGERL